MLIICVIYAEYQTFDCTNQHAFISLLISDEKTRKEGLKKVCCSAIISILSRRIRTDQ